MPSHKGGKRKKGKIIREGYEDRVLTALTQRIKDSDKLNDEEAKMARQKT